MNMECHEDGFCALKELVPYPFPKSDLCGDGTVLNKALVADSPESLTSV